MGVRVLEVTGRWRGACGVLNGDAVTLLAGALNYIILRVAAGGLPSLMWSRTRAILASALATAPMVLLMTGALSPAALWMLVTPLVMCLVAFGGAPLPLLWRAVGWVYAAAVGMAALVMIPLVLGAPTWPGLLVAPLVAGLGAPWVLREARTPWVRGHGLVRLRIWIESQVVALDGLVDTGSRLTDPTSGRPVLVTAGAAVWPRLDDQTRREVSRVWQGYRPRGEWPSGVGAVSVTTATGRGWLPVLRCPHAEMEVDGRWITLPPLAVALTESALAPDGLFQVLVPPELDARPHQMGA